jgi:hypothetical protein
MQNARIGYDFRETPAGRHSAAASSFPGITGYHLVAVGTIIADRHRVAGGSHRPPAPTEPSVRISRPGDLRIARGASWHVYGAEVPLLQSSLLWRKRTLIVWVLYLLVCISS